MVLIRWPDLTWSDQMDDVIQIAARDALSCDMDFVFWSKFQLICNYENQVDSKKALLRATAYLTHWGRDKMASIFQTTFLNGILELRSVDFF